MKETSLVAFNLLLNGIGSFAIGAVVAMVAARLLRGSPGRATVWLLTLPFAKVVVDVARGIPDQSFLWLRARGVSHDLGSFRVGLGVEHVVPKIDLALGALSGGVAYSQSAADLAASGLVKYVGAWAPGAVVVVLAVGAAAQLVRRGSAALQVRALRRRIERHPPHTHRTAGRRLVPIHVVPDLDGSPFTGGTIRPFVAFPERLWLALSDHEREAAILHELAHVEELHVPWTIATGLVADVFWFVPNIGRFHGRLVASCELCADARATKRGADPLALASALVRAREIACDLPGDGAMVLRAARGSLARRVAHLLQAPPASRFPRGRLVRRALFIVWAAATVVAAVPFGNH